jgi:hypothetical protein
MTTPRTARQLLLSIVTIVALLLIAVAPAAAITDGAPDGNAHPQVALMVAQDEDGNPLWRCSGTFISATVYLTAGHCTEAPAAHAEIFLSKGPIDTDPNYTSKGSGGDGCDDPAVTGYPCRGDAGGDVFTHPDYDPDAFYVRDLGIVELDRGSGPGPYATLPKKDAFDAYKGKSRIKKVTFTSVGYGLQKAFPDAAAWKDVAVRERMVAHPKLIALNTGSTGDFSLRLSNNTTTGGTCFGDSGGPNFLGTSLVIAGVTSYGNNSTCAGTGGVFRTDRSWSLDWINGFLD